MNVEQYVRQIITVKRDKAKQAAQFYERMYNQHIRLSAERAAMYLDDADPEQPVPGFTLAILRMGESEKKLREAWIEEPNKTLMYYENLLTDTHAMQKFIDRHISNEKTRAK